MLFDHQFDTLLEQETELLKQSLCREIDSWSCGLKEKYRAQSNCRANLHTPPSDLDNFSMADSALTALDPIPVQDVPLNLTIDRLVSAIRPNLALSTASFHSDRLPFDLTLSSGGDCTSTYRSNRPEAIAPNTANDKSSVNLAAVKQEIDINTSNHDKNSYSPIRVGNNVNNAMAETGLVQKLITRTGDKDDDNWECHQKEKDYSKNETCECNSVGGCKYISDHSVNTHQNQMEDDSSICIPGVFFPTDSRSGNRLSCTARRPMSTSEVNWNHSKASPSVSIESISRSHSDAPQHKQGLTCLAQVSVSVQSKCLVQTKQEILDEELFVGAIAATDVHLQPNSKETVCDARDKMVLHQDVTTSVRSFVDSPLSGGSLSEHCTYKDRSQDQCASESSTGKENDTSHSDTVNTNKESHEAILVDAGHRPESRSIRSSKPNCDSTEHRKSNTDCKDASKKKEFNLSKEKNVTERPLKRQKAISSDNKTKWEDRPKADCEEKVNTEVVPSVRAKSYVYSGKFLTKYSIPKLAKRKDKSEEKGKSLDKDKVLTPTDKERSASIDERTESPFGQKFTTAYINCQRSSCEETFQTRDELDRHMERVHDLDPYRCPLKQCTERVRDRQALFRHFRLDHKHVTKWKCYECFTAFPSSEYLYRHVIFEHFEGQFECAKKECDFVAKHRATVIQHFKRTHVKDFGFSKNYYEHKGKYKRNNSSDFAGKTNCYYGVRSEYYGSEDISTGEVSCRKYRVVTRKCLHDHCQTFFFSSEDMDKHLDEVHSILQHRCSLPGCDRSFRLRQELVDHIEATHGEGTVWKCAKCMLDRLKAFKDEHSLYRHLSLSHHEGQYRCGHQECHYVAKYRSEVIRHYDNAHYQQPQQSEDPSSVSCSPSSSSCCTTPNSTASPFDPLSTRQNCGTGNEDGKISSNPFRFDLKRKELPS